MSQCWLKSNLDFGSPKNMVCLIGAFFFICFIGSLLTFGMDTPITGLVCVFFLDEIIVFTPNWRVFLQVLPSHYWQSLTIIDHHQPSLAIIDHHWQLPVVPHKAVAEVLKIGHYRRGERWVVVMHWWTERWLELCFLEWLQWSPQPQLLDVVWCRV